MNKARMLELARLVEATPPKLHSMEVVLGTTTECGTIGCIAGRALCTTFAKEAGVELVGQGSYTSVYVKGQFYTTGRTRLARELLELTDPQARALFFDDDGADYPFRDRDTPAKAAAFIRRMVEAEP